MRILMVCLGNICRSPMAEYVMRHLVAQAGAQDRIIVDSAATSRYQIGEQPHRGTKRVLAAHGIPCGFHKARQITKEDYDRYDLIVGMDAQNRWEILCIVKDDPKGKIHSLLDWADSPRDIADPWYTNDFNATYDDVLEGCTTLLAHLLEKDPRSLTRFGGAR